ncbi:MAG TPA: PrsW family glutamic-type intramembrane protease [Anaerolineaceae bacterium]
MSSRPAVHWPSLAQFAYSGFVLVAALGGAAGLAISAGLGLARSPSAAAQPAAQLVGAAGAALVGLLAIPSAVLALLRLLRRPLPGWASRPTGWLPHALSARLLIAAGIAVLWGISLAAGGWAASQRGAGLLLLAPLYILAAGLPVAAYLVIGAGGLAGGSQQRRWGILSAELVGTALVVLVVELLVLALVGLIIVLAVVSQPGALAEIQRLAAQLKAAQVTPENLGRILQPFLRPWMLYLGIAVIAGIAPLIEELLKPLPLWFFARRGLTASEGFVGGLICGAGFALFESLGDLTSVTGASWLPAALGRGGTDLLHILNGGLMGWALALAWSQGRSLRLVLTYLLVAGVHGLWNAISLLLGALPLVGPVFPALLHGQQANYILGAGLVVIYLLMFWVLVRTNQRLGRSEPVPAQPPLAPLGENTN